MKNFQPFKIEHLQLNSLGQFSPAVENYYVVIWWQRIPLGNLWLYKEDGVVDKSKLLEKIKAAIEPAVNYYLLIHKIGLNNGWVENFLQGDFKVVEEALERSFSNNQPSSNPGLSVVICTRNRPKAIEQCIKSLLNSNDKDFELIVVDNAPDDDKTEQVLKQYPQVKYVKEPCKGLDRARNTGARHALRAIIAYTDDDVMLEPNWTKIIKTLFQDQQTMAVTGLVIPASLETKSQFIFEKEWGFNKGYLPKVFDKQYFAANVAIGVPAWDVGAGANMAFRREVFDVVGWFDERLDVGASGCSGDSEFWYRILAEGWTCNYFPHLFVYHQHRESEAALKNQIFNYMRGQVSSVLVQYENYHHEGDLLRVKKSLPEYYSKKLLNSIKHLHLNNLRSIITEISGCISGYQYFKRHNNVKKNGPLLYLKSLDEDAKVNKSTKVSVVIPCYNHGQYLSEAIESVLNQTYKNIEIVVVNDGSTDNTEAVCKSYPKVKYVYSNNSGLSAARNTGVKHSTGNYLIFLDADDYLYPRAVEINLWYFSEFKKIAFVSGAHDKIDEKGNFLPVEDALDKSIDNYTSLLQGNYIAMEGTVMYRRDLFQSFFFDPRLKACEDYDINLNIARYFPSISHSNKLAVYRIHNYNMSADKNLMLENVIKVLDKQKPLLKEEAELAAYHKGIQNWKNYYLTS